MQKLRHTLFGKSVEIDVQDREFLACLSRELSHYPVATTDPDMTFSVVNRIELNAISRNPALHAESEHAILLQTLLSEIQLDFTGSGKLSEIEFRLKKNPNLLRKYTQKLIDLQFTSREERIGQILHEQVFIPWSFLLSDRIPIHAAAVKGWSGKAILLGGSGGVGKTSLELELCLNHGYHFLADDISVLSTGGTVYPNLSYPKIYGYNQLGDDKLANSVNSGRSVADRLHWQTHRLLRGPSGVRRRVSPVDLYGGFAATGVELASYYLLVRTDVSQIEKVSIDPGRLAHLSVAIMKTEYDWFFKHLYWHELNRTAMGKTTILDPQALFKRWETGLEKLLQSVECQMIRIPMNLSHSEFKKQMAAII